MTEIQVNLRIDEKLAILDLSGDVTGTAEKKIVNAFDKATAQKTSCVILNFSQVNYINSAGMSIIITLLTQSQQRNISLCAFGLSSHFQKIFEMVGLNKYVEHYASEEEARASCA